MKNNFVTLRNFSSPATATLEQTNIEERQNVRNLILTDDMVDAGQYMKDYL